MPHSTRCSFVAIQARNLTPIGLGLKVLSTAPTLLVFSVVAVSPAAPTEEGTAATAGPLAHELVVLSVSGALEPPVPVPAPAPAAAI